jgi:hypothetical protein
MAQQLLEAQGALELHPLFLGHLLLMLAVEVAQHTAALRGRGALVVVALAVK